MVCSSRSSRLVAAVSALAIHRDQGVADADAARHGHRTERQDLADAQSAAPAVLRGIEPHAQPARAWGRPPVPGGAEKPRCEALSSPIINCVTRRISSGVRDDCTRGA